MTLVCVLDDEPVSREPCPKGGPDHTPQPKSYLGWHSWASRMGQDHRQVRCESCGTLGIWVPSVRGPKAVAKASAKRRIYRTPRRMRLPPVPLEDTTE